VEVSDLPSCDEEKMSKGLRIKGGVQYGDLQGVRGFYPIVHIWENADCIGEAEEWVLPQRFDTEDEALTHYKKYVRPIVIELAEMDYDQADFKIEQLLGLLKQPRST
jgi:hypothetical protein